MLPRPFRCDGGIQQALHVATKLLEQLSVKCSGQYDGRMTIIRAAVLQLGLAVFMLFRPIASECPTWLGREKVSRVIQDIQGSRLIR